MDRIAAFIPLVEIGAKRDWHGLWPNWCISEPFFLFFLWQCGNFRFTIRHSHLLAAISDISWFTSDSRSHPNFLLVTSPWPMMVCSVLIYHHFQASRCLKSFRTQFGRDRDSHFHSGHRWILRLGILRLLFQVPCCAQGVLVRKTRRMTSKNQSYLKEVIYIWYIWYLYMFIISPPFQHVNHRGFLSLNHIFNGPWHFDRQTDGPAGRERTRLCLREGHSWWICLFCQLQRDLAMITCDPWNPWNHFLTLHHFF